MTTPLESESPQAESPLEFPCEFPLKVFGEDTPEFTEMVFTTIKAHIPNLQPSAVVRKESSKGRYVALTVTFTATSREQLDRIYRELTAQRQVLMAL